MVAQILLSCTWGLCERDAVSRRGRSTLKNTSYKLCYAQRQGQHGWPAQGMMAVHPYGQEPASPYKTRVVGAALPIATAHTGKT